ncbi:MAG: transcription factor S [Nanoarchaeota archaeon]|nr:transcription factor S [Nanoarchaeota archaeon]MBU1321208.1 transcription factor S [Nanoarchaeota archaeon]MBU1597013.1 transcription factor S [Nanoarchaeota archaeon]MBU2441841.1 transcription factor S [Nanoarchaeota archaeon]
MFCPKCGSLLKPKTEKKKKVLACSCGYTSKDLESAEIKEDMAKDEKEIEVVEENDSVLPETDVKCPECGHDKAGYWMLQTRAGDEPETKFLKCRKCKHVWRDYS